MNIRNGEKLNLNEKKMGKKKINKKIKGGQKKIGDWTKKNLDGRNQIWMKKKQ